MWTLWVTSSCGPLLGQWSPQSTWYLITNGAGCQLCVTSCWLRSKAASLSQTRCQDIYINRGATPLEPESFDLYTAFCENLRFQSTTVSKSLTPYAWAMSARRRVTLYCSLSAFVSESCRCRSQSKFKPLPILSCSSLGRPTSIMKRIRSDLIFNRLKWKLEFQRVWQY